MRVLSLFIILFLTFSWNAVADSTSFNNSLVDAADKGDIQEVRRLLNSGVKPDIEGEFGVTALMRAAFRGHVDVAELLIKSGAYVNASDIGGDTALHMASRSGNAKMVKMLLHYDASIDAVDNQQWTPLMRAIMAKSPEVTEVLIDEGADLNAKNNVGNSSLVQAAILGKESVLKVILSSKKFNNIPQEQKESAVAISKKRGHSNVSQMISSTIDYYEKDKSVKTAYNDESQYSETAIKSPPKIISKRSTVNSLDTLVNNDNGAWGFDESDTPFAVIDSPYSEMEKEPESSAVIDNKTEGGKTQFSNYGTDENHASLTSPYSNNVNTPKTKPVTSSPNTGYSRPVVPVAYFADRYTIQVGAFSEKTQADHIWKNLKNEHSDILSGLEPSVLMVNDNSGSSFFRLRVGSFLDKGAASRKCVQMQQRKIDCFVVRSSREQTPMMKEPSTQDSSYEVPVKKEPAKMQVDQRNNSVDSNTNVQTNYFSIVPINRNHATPSSASNEDNARSVNEEPVLESAPESVNPDAPIDTMPYMNNYDGSSGKMNYNQSPHSYLYKKQAANESLAQDSGSKNKEVKNVKKYEPMNELFVAPYQENEQEALIAPVVEEVSSDTLESDYEAKQYAGYYENTVQRDLWKDERTPGKQKVGQHQQRLQPPAVERGYQEPIDMYAGDSEAEALPWLGDNAVVDRAVVETPIEPVKRNNMIRKEDFSYSVNSNAEKQHDYNSFYKDLKKPYSGKDEVSEAVLVKESNEMPWLNESKVNNYITPRDMMREGIWLEVYPFPNRATASDYADRMFKYDEGLKNLQVKLLGGDNPYDRRVRLNVGPVDSYVKANMLCHNIVSSGLQCYSSGSPMEKSDSIYIIDDNYSDNSYEMKEHSEDIAYTRKAVQPRVKKLTGVKPVDIQTPYWINLGAFSNSYKAEYYLMFLKEDHDDLLKSTTYTLDTVKQYKRDKSNAVKLKLGPYFDKFNADNICSILRSRNVSCLVIK